MPTHLKIVIVFVFMLSGLAGCTSTSKRIIQLPALGLPDPHLREIDGRFWLFAGRDVAPTTPAWVMPFWDIYVSDDLVNWSLERTIGPKDNYMPDESDQCWAPDAISRNGYTYFYFSNHNKNTGVMRAQQPQGPYKDLLGRPLLAEDLTLGKEFDPTVFVDDDPAQTPYIVFGYKGRGGYFIARLNEDMMSLAETPRLIEINQDDGKQIDKNYLHKYGDTYYLSSGGYYSTAKNIYGPYTFKGLVGVGHGLGVYSHGSFMPYKGQWYHIWTRYLDRTKSRFRESMITYSHYRENGALVSDTRYLDQHKAWGVGRYHAAWNKIEAEWFFAADGMAKSEDPTDSRNFFVESISAESALKFPNIEALAQMQTVLIRVKNLNSDTDIQLLSGRHYDHEVGRCAVPKSQEGGFGIIRCPLNELKNNSQHLKLVFSHSNANQPTVLLDWLAFE